MERTEVIALIEKQKQIQRGKVIKDTEIEVIRVLNEIQNAIGTDSEKKKKTVNGREIEYLDVVHHSTTTKFNWWDRIKILLGKSAVTNSELYTQHDWCKIVGSEAMTSVERLMPKKSVSMMQMAEPVEKKKAAIKP